MNSSSSSSFGDCIYIVHIFYNFRFMLIFFSNCFFFREREEKLTGGSSSQSRVEKELLRHSMMYRCIDV